MSKYRLPFNGNVKLTSPFGNRILNGAYDYHAGVDLVGIDDITVRAPCDGIIGSSTIIVDRTNLTWQWGNYVRLDTQDGLYIFMCHLASRAVQAGQRVKKGDIIGIMGNTGYSFGAHTHFELRNAKGESINPCPFLGIDNIEGIYRSTVEHIPEVEELEITEPDPVISNTSELPESEWSKKEGWWAKATAMGIVDGKNPRGNITREQLTAVLGRCGLLNDK